MFVGPASSFVSSDGELCRLQRRATPTAPGELCRGPTSHCRESRASFTWPRESLSWLSAVAAARKKGMTCLIPNVESCCRCGM
jgi:hypothetical protein